MIPNKMEILRKSYGGRVVATLKNLAIELEMVTITPADLPNWSITFPIDFVTNEVERSQIRFELAHAGWGCVFKYRSNDREELVIYLQLT